MRNIMKRRTLLRNALVAGALLPVSSIGSALAAVTEDDPYLKYVHPDLRPIAARMLKMFAAQPRYSRETLPAFRKGAAAYSRPPLAGVAWQQKHIPGPSGGPEVSIIVVNDKPGERRPAILHMHGGGFIIGSAQGGLHDIQDLARILDCVVVSVEYRLAPEVTFAGSIEDNYAALKWLYANADELGADRTRIAVYGGSAGGGHAALLAITARDRGEVPIAFQCLIYPMLDDRTGSTRPVPAHVGKIIWTPQSNQFGWESFLGVKPGSSRVPTRGVPARTPSLAGLPPAFIGVGSIDLFHDEDVDYAQRLNDAGVPTELIVVPGAFHGFDSAGLGTPIADWFNAAKVDALRQALGVAPATAQRHVGAVGK
jgi:acetyl esterase/lipase